MRETVRAQIKELEENTRLWSRHGKLEGVVGRKHPSEEAAFERQSHHGKPGGKALLAAGAADAKAQEEEVGALRNAGKPVCA